MKKRISHIAVHKTALTSAILTAGICLPFVLILSVSALLGEGNSTPGFIFTLLLPLLYFIIGYIFTAIWCALYNVLARKTKLGIVLTLEGSEDGLA